MRHDVRPVSGSGDPARFSGVLLEVAGWLEARGERMWTVDELSPEALLERYEAKEMRLGLHDGEPAATMVVREEDELF